MAQRTGEIRRTMTQLAEEIFRPRMEPLIDELRRNCDSRKRLDDEANIITEQIKELEKARLDFINNQGYMGGRRGEEVA